MLNPIMAIPFILTPLVTGTIGYFATAGSIGAVVTQLICIVVSVLIYLPFVKASNRVIEKEVEEQTN